MKKIYYVVLINILINFFMSAIVLQKFLLKRLIVVSRFNLQENNYKDVYLQGLKQMPKCCILKYYYFLKNTTMSKQISKINKETIKFYFLCRDVQKLITQIVLILFPLLVKMVFEKMFMKFDLFNHFWDTIETFVVERLVSKSVNNKKRI